MQLIEHGLAVRSEAIGEFRVQIQLKGLVNPGNAGATSITPLARARLAAGLVVWAAVLNYSRCFGCNIGLRLWSPDKQGRVLGDEVRDPLVGLFKHVHIDTIFVILLLMGIQEKI